MAVLLLKLRPHSLDLLGERLPGVLLVQNNGRVVGAVGAGLPHFVDEVLVGGDQALAALLLDETIEFLCLLYFKSSARQIKSASRHTHGR